eukprot:TRINITY_DN19681_c0_g1_i4.p1 TRINITY_DN19681_c0_g1~~TRINITY_DN19681_c0_g1_i4.p1  ORF type:complete len:616 (+),score=68.94 TRINITY_DN19681_c0_g1_i4:70-1848(+)
MARRDQAEGAVRSIIENARQLFLQGLISHETGKALHDCATETSHLLSEERTKTRLLYSMTELSKQCVAVVVSSGLSTVAAAQLLSEGLAVVASVFVDESDSADDDGFGFHVQRSGLVARVLEPLCEALDGVALEIFTSLRRLEAVLEPRWQTYGCGYGGKLCFGALEAEDGQRDANLVLDDIRLYQSLQGVCVWVLALVIHVAGRAAFTASSLWEFASGDPHCAFVFAGSILGFQPGSSDHVRAPHDFHSLQRTVLVAMLGLVRQDLAFEDCFDTDDGSINMVERNEFILLRHAAFAAAAADCKLLSCLLAYPWVGSNGVVADIPALARFLADLSTASVLATRNSALIASAELIDRVQVWSQHLREASWQLWDLLVQVPAPTRSVLREYARLSYVVPPSRDNVHEICQGFLLGVDNIASDPYILATLVAFSANAGCAPNEDPLTAVLQSASPEIQSAITKYLLGWPSPIQEQEIAPWMTLLTGAQHVASPPEPVRQETTQSCTDQAATPSLRDLLSDAPSQFRCSLDDRLLVDPVRSPSGYLFERSSLARALEISGGHCPITHVPLSLQDCQRDADLRLEILKWVRQSRSRH